MTLIPRKCDEKSIEYEKSVRVPLNFSLKSELFAHMSLRRKENLLAGVENHNGCKIRTTSGAQNHHVLPHSSSHHHINVKKKNDNKVMDKGKKLKKHELLERHMADPKRSSRSRGSKNEKRMWTSIDLSSLAIL
ncbi:hypothetical protein IGI04_039811 [Brassica rapa subsp. trilocularis]|uniref:Uncharacterized protein n=1 Tax=Brassica rapa subsp. trilocularis TaxID=1813537 RepID=A0ABQ7KNZ6_BRACM|nr:hypothetical protein IGI04_039811 [Brassica rapa subsp. trilocularis]